MSIVRFYRGGSVHRLSGNPFFDPVRAEPAVRVRQTPYSVSSTPFTTSFTDGPESFVMCMLSCVISTRSTAPR